MLKYCSSHKGGALVYIAYEQWTQGLGTREPKGNMKTWNMDTLTAILHGLLFLRLVSEACQMSMSAQMFSECHWSACTNSHLAENHHLTCSWSKAMDWSIFVTFWVEWGFILGHFTLNIAELCCNQPLHDYPPSTQNSGKYSYLCIVEWVAL